MIILTSLTIYLCSQFTMINNTEHPWITDDAETVVRTANNCFYKYRSCLKTFIKKDKKDYTAICK